MKRILRRAASALGYEIRRHSNSLFANQKDVEAALRTVRPYTMLPRERLVSLYDQVAFCDQNNVDGALVECGVWKGGAVGLMALATRGPRSSRRDIHLFDSFADICEPRADRDGDHALEEAAQFSGSMDGQLVPMTGFYDSVGGHGTLEECQHLLEETFGYPKNQLHYHVGWFQDTLPPVSDSIGPIALLRLDGDWYDSTLVCLESLYDSVVRGGFVVIDDYGTYEGCRRAVDEFIASRKVTAYLHRVDAGCRYFQKP